MMIDDWVFGYPQSSNLVLILMRLLSGKSWTKRGMIGSNYFAVNIFGSSEKLVGKNIANLEQ
ncbi:hypothetical protein [Sulfuriflexus sp.]|uniref:hypothetical protein n=1 Tax=Sulfuriflexus sp. TaxID=2015443 RepID=UPI0028CE1BD2|nr:hypothetical protein [Sulfuriflexus sp.]MDT8405426.1 hypothetical protein [Sulfuriflexus sp.]